MARAGFWSGARLWRGGGLGLGGWSCGRSRRNDRRALDDVKFGETLVEVRLSRFFDLRLVDAGAVAVSVVEHFDDFHPVAVDGTEWCEAVFVEKGVVFEIDEDLRRAGVWPGGGEDDRTFFVGLRDRVVFDFGLLPCGGDGGIGTDAELRDEIGDSAEDDGVVIEVVFDEIVEAVGAERCPGAIDGNGEVAARGDEFDHVGVGRLFFEQRGMK